MQSMADRYTYLPLTGLFVIIAWGLSDLTVNWKYRKVWLTTSSMLVIFSLTIFTWKQISYWENNIGLLKHTLQSTSDNCIIENALGLELYKANQTDEAIQHFLQAIRILPNFINANYNLQIARAKQSNEDDAIKYYLHAIKIDSTNRTEAYENLGEIFYEKREMEKAIHYYSQAIIINPNLAEAHNNLGPALYKNGNIQEAIKEFHQAIKLKPDLAEAYNSLGVALIQTGNIHEAIGCFKKALQINPNYNSPQKNLELLIEYKKMMD
jgi:tetratricopeptide (TPR) repeat protein